MTDTPTPAVPVLGTVLTLDTVVAADVPGFLLIAMDSDGSRRIVDRSAASGRNLGSKLSALLAKADHWEVWGPTPESGLSYQDFPSGHYLPYPPADGVAVAGQEDPVNQHGYLPTWRADVARFCHSFDALPGFESFRQLSAAAKVTAFQVGQTIGGHAWERMAFWLTYDASLSGDWKLPLVMDPVRKAREAVCIECQSPAGGLHLATNINPTTFAAKLALGRIHGTNRTVTPWEPGELLTVVPAPDEDTTVATAISAHVAAFNGARDYYLAHVAHEVLSHDHD